MDIQENHRYQDGSSIKQGGLIEKTGEKNIKSNCKVGE